MLKTAARAALVLAVAALASAPCQAAAQEGEDKVQKLLEMLEPTNSFKTRIQAAILLGRSSDPRVIKPLVACLWDDDYVIRGSAAISLGNIGNPDAVPSLIVSLKDSEPLVRTEARRSLVRLAANPKGLKAMLAAYKGNDPRVRAELVVVFGDVKTEESIKMLAAALGEGGTGGIGDAAAQVISGMDRARAVRILNIAMSSDDQAVRLKAEALAGKLRYPEFVDVLAGIAMSPLSSQESAAARDSLKKMKQHLNTQELSGQARKGEKAAREKAIVLLGIAGDEAAVRTLMDLLDDDQVFIRGRSAQALSLSGDRRALPKLEKMLKESSNQRIEGTLKSAINSLQGSD